MSEISKNFSYPGDPGEEASSVAPPHPSCRPTPPVIPRLVRGIQKKHRLREILKQEFDPALVCKAMNEFTSIQLAFADQVDVFIDLGMPDWRLDKLPDLYQKLISQKDILIGDGLSEIEISELETLLPKVFHLSEELSQYSIKSTMVQPDFNENNILIGGKSKALTFIDLGEISISHPFFSLLNGLQQIRKHHALTEDDERYLRIQEACFKNYMNFESKKR